MQNIKWNLFNAFSVRVDEVQHGSGTSMNGNSARKCFSDPPKLAETLCINEETFGVRHFGIQIKRGYQFEQTRNLLYGDLQTLF